MKYLWRDALTAVLAVLLVPGLLVNTARLLPRSSSGTEPEETESLPRETQPHLAQPIAVHTADGRTVEMELEEYLVGVVLGEMPADFEFEALKAQAVVARTYTLRMCLTSEKHSGASVCTNSDCCQAYWAAEDYLTEGGDWDDVEKVRIAVEQTAGEVLTYGGELIEAVYFSSSGGRTEDALAVWGSDIPYLQATDSPEEADTQTVTLTAAEFREAMGVDLAGPCELWLGAVTYTEGGGVDIITIGGVVYKGTEIRRRLGLRSTAFFMTAVGDHITVTTRGHGHRVGMSQYGAEALAVQGHIYTQILSHYYQGAVLAEYVDNGTLFG